MKKHISKKINTIVLSTGVVIFSLAAAFSGTIAWFNTTKAVTASAGSIRVVAPKGVSYDLYYLDHFIDENEQTKPGNFNPNPSVSIFTGYEKDYADAVFTKITYEDGEVVNDPNPTDISHLWPAHKLTYALVIADGSISTLSLSEWSETLGSAVTNLDNQVSLTWAIDIYGGAYGQADSGSPEDDVAAAYVSYRSANKTDVFGCREGVAAPASVDIVDDISIDNDLTIIFFTIEFSNSPSTFYLYDKETGKYTLSPAGNSNCYEGLGFNNMEFAIS